MAFNGFHIQRVKKLPNGDFSVDVSCTHGPYLSNGKPYCEPMLFEHVTLPASTKNIARLTDSASVNEGASEWLASHGGEWDKELVREYFECILES